ncbi:transglutaminase family protein [Stutzerimonas azotifigens]|uniref:transglutaminase family protein n=1 Tax=Stutzerimonas azotifigens TaxID=291995 RepID=UPI0004094E38|nr:transglutaminase family protein [Stutzerimonas azotifigens]
MTPQRLSCADQLPDLLACALTISAEHAPEADLAAARQAFESMLATTRAALPALPARELAQPLLRQMAAMGFAEDDETPRRPQAALLDRVLARRRGVPSMLAVLALEFARRLDIPLVAIDFPGRILVRSPAGDHLLDPVGGRRLYPQDCRELLERQLGAGIRMQAEHMRPCDGRRLLQCLSRELRELHRHAGDALAALKDAERVLSLGQATLQDHLARADLYRLLECPGGERYALEHALLFAEDAIETALITRRLRQVKPQPALH